MKKKSIHRPYYNNILNKEHNRYKLIDSQYYNLFIKDTDRVLDVGAGDGLFSKYLKGIYRGIDIDPVVNIKNVEKKTIFDIENEIINNKIKHYNIILFNHVIEHLLNVGDTLKCAYNCLKTKGYILIQVPYFTENIAFTASGHFNLFNEITLIRLLNEYKFKIIEYYTMNITNTFSKQKLYFKEGILVIVGQK